MKRRTCLRTILSAGTAMAVSRSIGRAAGQPVQLHVDLAVDPAKEKEMLHNFETIFRPAAAKQPGYIDVKMCKLREALAGKAPVGCNYRFVLTFATEDQRKQWVATPTHQKVWPTIENTLRDKNYTVLLYDAI